MRSTRRRDSYHSSMALDSPDEERYVAILAGHVLEQSKFVPSRAYDTTIVYRDIAAGVPRMAEQLPSDRLEILGIRLPESPGSSSTCSIAAAPQRSRRRGFRCRDHGYFAHRDSILSRPALPVNRDLGWASEDHRRASIRISDAGLPLVRIGRIRLSLPRAPAGTRNAES